MKHTFLFLLLAALLIPLQMDAQLPKIKDVGKKPEMPQKPAESPKPAATPEKKEETASAPAATSGPAALATYYKEKGKLISERIGTVAFFEWDEDLVSVIRQFDHAGLISRMREDAQKEPGLFKLYPKNLPTSGGGLITQRNLSDYTSFAAVAGDQEDFPFKDEHSKSVNQFYKDYIYWLGDIRSQEQQVCEKLRSSIAQSASVHESNRFVAAQLAVKQAEAGKNLLPNNPQMDDILGLARKNYTATIERLGKLISGLFHREHIQQVVVFKNKPQFGSEKEADLVEMIVPGQSAWITGYFAASNTDLGGIPTLVWLGPVATQKHKHKSNPFGYGDLVALPMYVSDAVKSEYGDKAYFTFPVFPDLNNLPFKSHKQYLPTLHFLKWLSYQNAEVIELQVKFGLVREAGKGLIRIDLSGDNRQKLMDYYNALWEKKLAAVTFPQVGNCADAAGSVSNLSDLDKYGKRLKVALSQTGDIMKPWPNDHLVEWNTANGYGAFETSGGKIEIINLEFRKTPGSAQWQFWSVGSIPSDYTVNDKGQDLIKPEILNYGFEVLRENATKCAPW